MAAMQQTSLGIVQGLASDLSGGLLGAGHLGQVSGVLLRSAEAEYSFGAALSALNSRHAGRYVFSGVAADQPAMAQADVILDALVAAVSLETTAAGVASVVDAWFAPGGGFDSVAYGGGTAAAPVMVAPGKSVSLNTTAEDPSIRDVLKGMGLAALVERPPLQGAPDQQLEIALLAGEVLIAGSDNMIEASARLGLAEEQIEDARTEMAAETTATSIALNDRVKADPFDFATDLQQIETQLELLYTLTARTSRLKLTDFL
jgi:flagellar hook-associated protein 3 FlgL